MEWQGGPRSFFSEIISSISDVRFSRDGRHMLSRDYMTVKLWDINMENRPIASFPVHEPLREKVRPSVKLASPNAVQRPTTFSDCPCKQGCRIQLRDACFVNMQVSQWTRVQGQSGLP